MNKKVSVFLLVVIIFYAIWNGRDLLLGPKIKIVHSISDRSVASNLVVIKGLAQNVSFLSLNGKRIFTDKEGNFTEKVVLLPGYNIIQISGEDRFGEKKDYTLKLYK